MTLAVVIGLVLLLCAVVVAVAWHRARLRPDLDAVEQDLRLREGRLP